MAALRWLIPALFVVAGLLFAAYTATGNPRWRRLGLRTLLAALLCAFGFFAVLATINLTG